MATRPRKSEEKASIEKATTAKAATANGKANGAKAAAVKAVAKATVRKPRAAKTEPPAVADEMIAERAYYIALSGTGASDHENWLRAEVELRAGA
jgi:hypothetical protein